MDILSVGHQIHFTMTMTFMMNQSQGHLNVKVISRSGSILGQIVSVWLSIMKAAVDLGPNVFLLNLFLFFFRDAVISGNVLSVKISIKDSFFKITLIDFSLRFVTLKFQRFCIAYFKVRNRTSQDCIVSLITKLRG